MREAYARVERIGRGGSGTFVILENEANIHTKLNEDRTGVG